MALSGLPFVGAQAVIAGMAAFNRDAAIVSARLNAINVSARRLEAQSGGAFAAVGDNFASAAAAISTGAVIIGAAMLGAGVASVKFAADFESSLAFTKAITGASAEQIGQLHDEIVTLSRDGTTSLGDLSTAATELGRAGVGMEAILGGALKAVNDLTIASGGELGLAAAAKLVANSINAFNLTTDDATRITTAATVVAQRSSATFTGFGEAVAIAGASFRAAGFTLEDLAIAETILTQRGMTASTAATALRGVIQRLEKPSKAAAEVMQDYGIHLFDAQGKGVGLRAVLGQLNAAFGDQAVATGKVTEEQRATALATLGLQRTSVALFNLAVEGTQAYDDLAAEFDKLSASDIVDQLLKPLNAQMQIAKNNVVALATAFGEGFLQSLHLVTDALVPFLRNLKTFDFKVLGEEVAAFGQAILTSIVSHVQGVIAFAQTLAQIPGILDAFKAALVGVGLVIAASLLTPIGILLFSIGELLLAVSAVTTTILLISSAVNNAGVSFASWLDTLGPVGEMFGNLVRSLLLGFDAVVKLLSGDFVGAINVADLATSRFFSSVRDIAGGALGGFGLALDAAGRTVNDWAKNIGVDASDVGLALSGVHGFAQSLQFLLQGNFAAAGKTAEAAMKNFSDAIKPVADALGGAIRTGLDWLTNIGWPKVQEAAQIASDFFRSEVVPRIQAVAGAIHDKLEEGLTWLRTEGFPRAQQAASDLSEAFDTKVRPAVQFLGDKIKTELIPRIEDLALIIHTKLEEALTWLRNEGFPRVQQAASDLQTEFDSKTRPAIERLAEEISGNLRSAITSLSTQTLPDLSAAFSGVRDSIDHTLERAGELGAWTNLQAALDNLKSAGSDLIAVIEGLSKALQPAQAAASDILGPILALISPIADWASKNDIVARSIFALTGEILNITEVVKGVVATIKLIGDAFNAIGQAADRAGGDVAALKNQLASFDFVGAGVRIATDIGAGISAGQRAAFGPVGQTGQQLGQHAVNSVAVGAQTNSPSEATTEVGVDIGLGLIDGFDKVKVPVQNAAQSLAQQAIDAFRDTGDKAERILLDLSIKMTRIGEEVGQKVNETIVEASRQIGDAIKQANQQIDDLNANLGQSRADRARRDALSKEQDAARQTRKRKQEDADADVKRTRDLSDAEFQLSQDLENATTDAQRASAQQKYDDKIADIQRNFLLDAAARADDRKRQDEDAAFERDLDKQTQDLNDTLENEALARSIDRTLKERDARIDAINQAMAEKQDAIRKQAAQELKDLQEDSLNKIDVLQKDFVDKAADLLAKGGAALAPLTDKIQQDLSKNFDEMRASARSFTDQVGDAINALNHLRELQNGGIQAPSNPDFTIPTEPIETTSGIPSFAEGGIVPGAYGQKMLAWVHAGEQWSGMLGQTRSLMANLGSYGGGGGNTYNTNYEVNPSYSNVESPASIQQDLAAMVMMTRG